MPKQAPISPSLPQNDTQSQRQARQAQLAASQAQYEWTDCVPSVEGVPVVKTLPTAENPTLEWWLKLAKIVLELARNQIEVECALIAQGRVRSGERLRAAAELKESRRTQVRGDEE